METSAETENVDRDGTLVDVLCRRAATQPDKVAFRFLADGETETDTITYARLHSHARSIAVALAHRCQPGDRALLLYPPGLDFIAAFLGCLYAGVVAIPLYCPRLNRIDARIQAVAANAQAAIAMTTNEALERMEKHLHNLPCIQELPRVATDDISTEGGKYWEKPPLVSRDSVAFLQYTSGSTAAPRGVMVTHGNLMANEEMIRQAFDWHENSVVVSWLPIYHDMGLIGNALQPIYAGIPCVLMPPASFLQYPNLWLSAVTKYKGTCIGAPNFAYDLCARRVTPEQMVSLDLSTVDLAYCGSEPIRASTIETFSRTFRHAGFQSSAFYPCYGLAEATLFATGGRKIDPPTVIFVSAAKLEANQVEEAGVTFENARTIVGCGRAWLDEQLVIVNPDTRCLCPIGEVGEIWIAGRHIAQGYWNNTVESDRVFNANLAADRTTQYLRTGDFGFIRRGELFVTGRLKDLIIIRGRNHYPQDIESSVLKSDPAVAQGRCAAFAATGGEQEDLIVVAELDRSHTAIDNDKLVARIRGAIVRDHGLDPAKIVLVRARTLPVTTSGKIQRHACLSAYLCGNLEFVTTQRVTGGLAQ